MRIFDYPQTRAFLVERCDMHLDDGVRANDNPFTGSFQTHEIVGAHRWRMTITWVPQTKALRAELEAWLAGLGRSNRVRMWHHARPRPLGTLSGAPTLAASAARGDVAITVNASPQLSATLEPGDMLGLGGHLFMARARAVATNGTLDVDVSPPVPEPIGSGQLVTLIRPTAIFAMVSPAPVPHTFGHSPAFSVEFRQQ